MLMIIQTLESLKWSVAISEVIHMLLQSLIMAVIVFLNEMQIYLQNIGRDGDWRTKSNFQILLLFFFQLNNNFLIVFEGEVFL